MSDTYPTYENITLEFEGAVATLTFNRPDRLNAMSKGLQEDVVDALDRLEVDPAVRVVIITGAGRAFSAGYDIYGDDGPRDGWTVMDWKEHLASSWSYAKRVWRFRKPTIAAVHGYALAGACEIAMLCDMTISSDDCRFGEPEIRFATSSTLIMPWVVPMKVAKELLYSGKMIDAKRAYEVGMVNEVVPAEDVLRRAMYHAQMLSKVAPLAIELVKEGVNRTYEIMGLQSALDQHEVLTAMLDGSPTEEGETFRKIKNESGLRAAMDWRDSQFREVEELYGDKSD